MSTERSSANIVEPKAGFVDWLKSTRIAKVLHRLNVGRYETYVPKVYRKLGEERGIPKPERWIPSAEGTPIDISRLLESKDEI